MNPEDLPRVRRRRVRRRRVRRRRVRRRRVRRLTLIENVKCVIGVYHKIADRSTETGPEPPVLRTGVKKKQAKLKKFEF